MEGEKSSYLVPIAIVACLLLIAGAVYYKDKIPASGNQTAAVGLASTSPLAQILPPAEGVNLSTLRSIDSTDKVRGNVSAPIKLIVYTDLECPACKYFHQQIQALEAKYITTGQVAVVYRDFPLDSIHSKSRNEFANADCVNELGGTAKYWQFIDKIFEITPSNNGLDPAKLGETAKALGIDTVKLEACVKSNKYSAGIEKSVQEAMALGAQGTPFFMIIDPTSAVTPIFGGVPADRLGAAFDLLLNPNPAPVETPVTASTTAK